MSQCKYVKLEYLPQQRTEAYCKECDWKATNWSTGGLDGTAHAKETGHKVEVTKETGYIIHPFNK